jgi:hypothetical protein
VASVSAWSYTLQRKLQTQQTASDIAWDDCGWFFGLTLILTAMELKEPFFFDL